MNAWRWAVGVGLAVLVGVPLGAPLLGLFDRSVWQWTAEDGRRVLLLTSHTALLVLATLLIALPSGVGLALLCFRAVFPGRRVLLSLFVALLFVPLPVVVSSWQSLLGQGGLALWQNTAAADRPWATGWGPAIWVQALAALPWVVLIVGLGLVRVPAELEEDALQQTPRLSTFRLISLPQALPALGAAALLVAFLTGNDISVSGMMQIATFAEEFDTQFSLGNEAALARTALVALPMVVAMWGLLALLGARLDRKLAPLSWPARGPRDLVCLPRGWALVLAGSVMFLTAAPIAGLVWNLGLAGRPPAWSLSHIGPPLLSDARTYGAQIVQTLASALVTAGLVTFSAVLCCWLALDAGKLRAYLIALLTFAWLMPAPVVGIGLKQTIMTLVQVLPEGPWTDMLYRGPSPLPVMWAHFIRFLPVAVFVLWPTLRLLPRELRDAARLEGARPLNELLHLVIPFTGPALLVTTLAISALCLGEVGAGGRVETPNWEPFAKLILDRMHYGIDRNVSSLCLLLLGALATLGLTTLGMRVVGRLVLELRSGAKDHST